MIKNNKGNIEIEGNSAQVLAELTGVVRSLYRDCFIGDAGIDPEKAKADIMFAVEMAFQSDEEYKQEMKDGLKEVLKDLSDLLKDILRGKDDE